MNLRATLEPSDDVDPTTILHSLPTYFSDIERKPRFLLIALVVMCCFPFLTQCWSDVQDKIAVAEDLWAFQQWPECAKALEEIVNETEPATEIWEKCSIKWLVALKNSDEPDEVIMAADSLISEPSASRNLQAACLANKGQCLWLLAQRKGNLLENIVEVTSPLDEVLENYQDQAVWCNWARYFKAEACLNANMPYGPSLELLTAVMDSYPDGCTAMNFHRAVMAKCKTLNEMRAFSSMIPCMEAYFEKLAGLSNPEITQQMLGYAFSFLHQAYKRTGEWEDAAVFADRMLKSDREDTYGYIVRGRLHELLGQAIDHLSSRRDVSLLEAVEHTWGKEPTDTDVLDALKRVNKANRAHRSGDFGEALSLYKSAYVKVGCDNPVGVLVMKWIRDGYVLAGEDSLALDFVRKEVPRPWAPSNPVHKGYASLVADLVYSASNSGSVIEWYKELANDDPSAKGQALLTCIQFFLSLPESNGASETMKMIGQQHSTDREIAERISSIMAEIEEPYIGASLCEPLRQFAEVEPEILRQMGRFYQDSGRSDEAIPVLAKFVAECPSSLHYARGLLTLGQAYWDERRVEESQSVLRQIVKEMPMAKSSPKAMLLLAYIRIENAEYKQAKELLKDLIVTYPGTGEAESAQSLFARLKRQQRLGKIE